MADIDGTKLGSGAYNVVRVGSIGLKLPLAPTRAVTSEPAMFIPPRWASRIVRMGDRKLARARALAPFTLPPQRSGRSMEGCILPLPRATAIVLGRDPHPKDDAEKDPRQVCIEMLRVGAEAEKVSSAVVSFVRVAAADGTESVFAVNGHYSLGKARRPPTLFPLVADSDGRVVKHLNGPHVSQELSPGYQVYFGYVLAGQSEPKTYAEPAERLVYTEGLVGPEAALGLDALHALARVGEREITIAVDGSIRTSVTPPQEQPVLSRGAHGLVLDLDAAAARLARHGACEILVGADERALAAAAGIGATVDLLVLAIDGVPPVAARLSLREDGEMEITSVGATAAHVSTGGGSPHAITQRSLLVDGSAIQLGSARITYRNQRPLPTSTPPPRATGASAADVTLTEAPRPQEQSGLLSRLRGAFRRP